MTTTDRRLPTVAPAPVRPLAPVTPALTIRRYIDHALICSACCR
ncbi:hypothetical protein ACFVVX_16220 [Kitasatospora sp. NPDC058170]